MSRCIFTDQAECVKCVICHHTERRYKCVNCGFEGTTKEQGVLYAQRCGNCNAFIGVKECSKQVV